MKFYIFVLTLITGLSVLPSALQAAALPDSPHIITSARASVEAIPDIATLTIDARVSAQDATPAKTQLDRRVAQYFDFLEKNGIEKKDIEAANLQIQPEYDYSKNNEAVLKGYRATRQIQVIVRQLKQLNSLLEGALKLGLNEINAIGFAVAHPQPYQDKARKAAIDNAVRQAKALAHGFKVQLGPVYSIRYHSANDDNTQPIPMPRMFKALATANTAEKTYEQQTIRFDDQVEVVFKIKLLDAKQ